MFLEPNSQSKLGGYMKNKEVFKTRRFHATEKKRFHAKQGGYQNKEI